MTGGLVWASRADTQRLRDQPSKLSGVSGVQPVGATVAGSPAKGCAGLAVEVFTDYGGIEDEDLGYSSMCAGPLGDCGPSINFSAARPPRNSGDDSILGE